MSIDKGQLLKIRKTIKEFEHCFVELHNRKPTQDEVRQHPKIKEYYKIYFKYKHLLDGSESSVHTTPGVPVAPATAPTDATPPPHQNTNTDTDRTDAGNRSMQGVWNRRLNKPPETSQQLAPGPDKTGLRKRVNFEPVLQKIKRLNEQDYAEQLKRTKNKSYHYSLKFRKQYLEKKSAEIEPASSHRPAEPESATFFFDQILNSKPAEPEDGDEFYLDDLNETIKHSILGNDFIHANGAPEQNANCKRPIFALSEEIEAFPPIKRFKHDVDARKENKFFKSRHNGTETEPEYDPFSFFDHLQDLDFKATVADHSLLAQKKTTTTGSSTGLRDVTNQAGSNGKQNPASKKEPARRAVKKDNFRRLQMKKKVFARGHQRSNMKRYKKYNRKRHG